MKPKIGDWVLVITREDNTTPVRMLFVGYSSKAKKCIVKDSSGNGWVYALAKGLGGPGAAEAVIIATSQGDEDTRIEAEEFANSRKVDAFFRPMTEVP